MSSKESAETFAEIAAGRNYTVKEQIQNINAISKMESQTSPRWEIMRIKIVDFELRVVYMIGI
jgi:hypothetical protein